MCPKCTIRTNELALPRRRIPNAGGLQHHRQDLRRHPRHLHGAGNLQQLHHLPAAQGRLPLRTHKVGGGDGGDEGGVDGDEGGGDGEGGSGGGALTRVSSGKPFGALPFLVMFSIIFNGL